MTLIEAGSTAILLILGQSNASNLYYSDTLQAALSQTGHAVEIVGVHGGGLSIARPDGAWNIVVGDGSDTPGSSYVDLLASVDEARAEFPNAFVAGAVWLQGEADSYGDRIGDYYAPAATLFTQMLADLDEDFPILIVGLSDYQNTHAAGRAHVQEM